MTVTRRSLRPREGQDVTRGKGDTVALRRQDGEVLLTVSRRGQRPLLRPNTSAGHKSLLRADAGAGLQIISRNHNSDQSPRELISTLNHLPRFRPS